MLQKSCAKDTGSSFYLACTFSNSTDPKLKKIVTGCSDLFEFWHKSTLPVN
jgi:hypothetical protein